ncbi:MAG: hypothetical protein RLO51_17000 [Thalassobaculum sp.]|uniref:hypothetical protein n=1 Tax=Thalassobaculum sp. TaxID=2022740 RepID=UPI0032EC59A6
MTDQRSPIRAARRRFAGWGLAAWILAVPAVAGPLYDETGDPARRAIVDLAHQRMATCTAFFLIAAEGTPPTVANRAALDQLGQAADGLVGQMLRLRDETMTRARIEAERQWLMQSIGGSLTGYPRLHEALAGPCAKIAADPQGHIADLLAGKTAPESPAVR